MYTDIPKIIDSLHTIDVIQDDIDDLSFIHADDREIWYKLRQIPITEALACPDISDTQRRPLLPLIEVTRESPASQRYGSLSDNNSRSNPLWQRK